MFSIIHLAKADDVALVPTAWITDGSISWPPYKGAKLTKAIKECAPVEDGWEMFECRVLSSTGKFM